MEINAPRNPRIRPSYKLALIAILSIAVGACRGKHHRDVVRNEEPVDVSPRVVSRLKMGDAAAKAQLLRGFYGLEAGSWRWTAGTFAIELRPPVGAAQRGATLTFAFSIPDLVIEKLKTVTLTAAIGPAKLKSETWSKPGSFVYSAEIAPDLLAKDTVVVDFKLDKNLPPGSVDQRELGVVATAAGIESK